MFGRGSDCKFKAGKSCGSKSVGTEQVKAVGRFAPQLEALNALRDRDAFNYRSINTSNIEY